MGQALQNVSALEGDGETNSEREGERERVFAKPRSEMRPVLPRGWKL